MEEFILSFLYAKAAMYNLSRDKTKEVHTACLQYMASWWRWLRETHPDFYWDRHA